MTVSVSSSADPNAVPARASQPRVKLNMSWTREEDDLVRAHFENRPKLRALLPHRSREAIESRVYRLGLNLEKRYFVITAKDAARIAQLVTTCRTYQEVADVMGISMHTVRNFMKRKRIHFTRSAPKMTGVPLVDAVRQRAFNMKLSMRDLDRSLGYRAKCFSRSNCAHLISIGQIAKAAKALGGRLEIVWEDEQEACQ
nr:hypothetical protein [Brucella anthropi]